MRALFLVMLAAATAAAEPAIRFERFELPNGLRVYVIEDHKAPIVTEILWVQAGSKDEVVNRTGFAHLFEHLMFKGSAHLPDGLMDRVLEEAGGLSTAFTSSDMTVYINVAASNFLESVLWIEADRLVGLLDTFDKAKLDNQRDVVLNERRQRVENAPYGSAGVLLGEHLWPKSHGYHWPTIGYAQDLRAAAVPDVARFFKTYYVPNNATMVIAGDVTLAHVKPLVEKYFAWIARAPAPARPVYKQPPAIAKEIVIETTDDVQVPRVYAAWRGPASFSADEPAAALAAAILGDGKASRLYKRLVYDDKLAQDATAYYQGAQLGGELGVIVTAKPGVEPRRLVAALNDELAKLAKAAPDAAELERVQSSRDADFLRGLESVRRRAVLLAQYDVQAKDPAYLAKDLARYRAVTPVQIQGAVAKYLPASARVTLTVLPGKKVSP